MKVKYNSPVILSLTFAAIAVKLINDKMRKTHYQGIITDFQQY